MKPAQILFLAAAALVACDGKQDTDTPPGGGTPAGTVTGNPTAGTGTGTGTGTTAGTGGGVPTGPFQLGFRGQYPLNAGQTIYFGVVDDSQDLIWSTSNVVPGNGNIETVFDVPRGTGAHVLFWWADVDADGVCDGPAQDQDNGWSEQIGNPPTPQEQVQRDADTNFAASVCGLSW